MAAQTEITPQYPPTTTWIEPAGRIEATTIRCSTIDNLTAPVYPSPTMFFPLTGGEDFLVHFEDLKQGLARTLWVQPQLCGVIRKDEAGRASIEIAAAPNAGAALGFKDLRNDLSIPSYEQFRQHGYPIADGESDGLSAMKPDPFPSCQDGEPIICPQISLLRGGFTINFSIAHTIGDLVQCKTWVGIWARNTRAIAEARIAGLPQPPLPPQTPAHLLDRSRLTPSVAPEEDLDKLAARAAKLPHMTMLDPRDPEKMGEMLSELFTKSRLTHEDLANHDEDVLRTPLASVWTFPLDSIQKLKGAAVQVYKGKISQIDCLTAFIWQRFFLAKWAPTEAGPEPVPETTRIVFAGSVRHRLTPALPNDYLPACVDLFPVIATTSDFTTSNQESLVKAAKLVRTSNDEWSEQAYIEMCEIAEAHPMNPGLIPTGPIDVLVTDHTRSTEDLLENWGPGLGLCEALREPYFGRTPPPGELTLMPRWGNGTVEVMVAGEAVAIERLKNDPLMNAMAKCQFVMHDFAEKIAKSATRSKL